MIKPIPYNAIESRFGVHGDITTQVKVKLPFKMYLSWKPEIIISTAYVHPFIADDLEAALTTVLDTYGVVGIDAYNLNEWGGSFNDRYSRGSSRWSVHAWGLAVDYLPSLGPFRQPAATPYHIVDIFKDHGFLWGGDWSLPDGMHFTGIKE